MPDRPTRHTQPRGLPALTDQEIADKEAENGLLQFDRMFAWIDEAMANDASPLSPDRLRTFQGLAVEDLEYAPGEFRKGPVGIGGSVHEPPPWEEVVRHVDEMCDYLAKNWDARDAVHLAAYVMWRLNWIHPFTNGNGRTSRVASYLVLCAKLRTNLPGDRTIADIIDEDKTDYYAALDDADAKWKVSVLDVSVMENVIREALKIQLAQALN